VVDTGRTSRAAHSSDPRSRSRGRRPAPTTVGGLLREAAVVLVVALVLASLLRAFVLQAFVIPSGSMEDTLDINDRVVVSKLTTRFGSVHRGDVVVFSDPGSWLAAEPVAVPPTGVRGAVRHGLQFVGLVPNDAQGHLIKRVIGVPGDRVQSDANSRVRVNGYVLPESDYLKPGANPTDCTFDVTVPAGSLFVLGDNRGNSGDSRFHGLVPISLVTGRAVARVWPVDRIGGLGAPSTFEAVPAPTAASRQAPAQQAAPGAQTCTP